MTPAMFVQLFPEFAKNDPVLIQGKLLLAAARMGGPDFTVWGQPGTMQAPAKVDLAQGSYAAHLLMTSPQGASTLLAQDASKGGAKRTPYLDQFEEIELGCAGGFVVAGSIV